MASKACTNSESLWWDPSIKKILKYVAALIASLGVAIYFDDFNTTVCLIGWAVCVFGILPVGFDCDEQSSDAMYERICVGMHWFTLAASISAGLCLLRAVFQM